MLGAVADRLHHRGIVALPLDHRGSFRAGRKGEPAQQIGIEPGFPSDIPEISDAPGQHGDFAASQQLPHIVAALLRSRSRHARYHVLIREFHRAAVKGYSASVQVLPGQRDRLPGDRIGDPLHPSELVIKFRRANSFLRCEVGPPGRFHRGEVFARFRDERGGFGGERVVLSRRRISPDLNHRITAGRLQPGKPLPAIGQEGQTSLPHFDHRPGNVLFGIREFLTPIHELVPGLWRVSRIETGGTDHVHAIDHGKVMGIGLGNSVHFPVYRRDLAVQRRDLLPPLPRCFVLINQAVAVRILADPLVQWIKEALIDIRANNVDP